MSPELEAVGSLSPLIDPRVHSCGTVPPHGYNELQHPERDFYVVGMKSYGRAPNFLMLTGYEQVRSIAAALAGDMESAMNVELVLPETGVCVTDGFAGSEACCGPASTAALAGEAGCCGPTVSTVASITLSTDLIFTPTLTTKRRSIAKWGA